MFNNHINSDAPAFLASYAFFGSADAGASGANAVRRRAFARASMAFKPLRLWSPNPNLRLPCLRHQQETPPAADAAAYAFFGGVSDVALDGELGGLDEDAEDEVAALEEELDIEAEREDEDLSCTSILSHCCARV